MRGIVSSPLRFSSLSNICVTIVAVLRRYEELQSCGASKWAVIFGNICRWDDLLPSISWQPIANDYSQAIEQFMLIASNSEEWLYNNEVVIVGMITCRTRGSNGTKMIRYD